MSELRFIETLQALDLMCRDLLVSLATPTSHCACGFTIEYLRGEALVCFRIDPGTHDPKMVQTALTKLIHERDEVFVPFDLQPVMKLQTYGGANV